MVATPRRLHGIDTHSTIVAVGSPPGRSARGIVRVSGDDSLARLEGLCGRALGRGLHTARIDVGVTIPALVLVFPRGRSYTGEDAFELQLAGNPDLLDRVVRHLVDTGVRPATAGEFTARAYLSGRLDLTEAEGVAATIEARSDAELRAAGMLRRGELGERAAAWSETLAGLLALVEAGIDFTDQEDVVAITPADLATGIDALVEAIQTRLGRAVGAETLAAIPWVVLSGAPNAGKSTLFNALVGRRRAVVSSVPGTTRDALVEPIEIETGEVLLVDIAGTETPVGAIDEAMQAAARTARRRAALVVRCIPADERDVAAAPGELLVRTKADLGDVDGLAVSAHSGAGIRELRAVIAARLADRAVALEADVLALQPRHEAALQRTLDDLAAARSLVDPAVRSLDDPELVAASMRGALDGLGELAGHVTADDVLGRVFATFCVGK